MGHLAIEASEDGIFVTATNLDVGVRMRMAGKMIESGGVVVPARIMGELVQSLPLGSVELQTLEDSGLLIKAQRTRAKLQLMKFEEFPLFPTQPTLIGEISVGDLNVAYEQIGFAVSTDESRPILTGFLWQGEKGVAAATDGYRLSLSADKSVWGMAKGSPGPLIVPGKAMIQLLQAFEDFGCKNVRYGYSEKSNELMFVGDDIRGVVRVLSGEFPKFEGILPGEASIEFHVNREQMLTAVKSVAIFARDSANIMRFSIEDGRIEFSANTAQVGENVVEVEADFVRPGKGVIAFNSRYLVDFLSHSKSEKIGFGMTDSLKPGLFYEVGIESYKHVIMPVRVKA